MKNINTLQDTIFDEEIDYYPKENSNIVISSKCLVTSRFSDDCWDLSSLNNTVSPSKIYFNIGESHKNQELVLKIKYEMKLIIFALLNYRVSNNERNSISTVKSENVNLRYIASLCLNFDLAISECDQSPFLYNQFMEDISKLRVSTRKKILFLVRKISFMNKYFKNHNLGFSNQKIEKIEIEINKALPDKNQTLLIPTRIYSNFIKNGDVLFIEYLSLKNNIELWFSELSNNDKFGCSGYRAKKGISFNETIEKFGLTDFCNKYEVTNKQKFTYLLKDIQGFCFAYFLCFTGMRENECGICAFNAFQTKKVQNNIVYCIESHTSKLVGLKHVKALWVTSKNLISANEVAQSICKIGLKLLGLQIIDESKTPLFISFAYPVEVRTNIYPDFPLALPDIVKSTKKFMPDVIVSKSDVDEIAKVNANYIFDKSIKIGSIWHFKTHQFRRSLAIYCARSGLVSLPALTNQLKHIETDMTAYYANGAMFAKNIIEAIDPEIAFDEDFIKEFNNELIEGSYDSFIADTTQQKNPLFGPHGVWLEVQKAKGFDVEFYNDRAKTIKQMKDGRLAYKRTPIGGCSLAGDCNRLSFAHISACVTCPNAVFNDRSIKALNALKKSLSSMILTHDERSPYRIQTELEIKGIEKMLTKSNIETVE